MNIDIDRILARFKNLLECQKILQVENISAYFNERELKEMISLLEELKTHRRCLGAMEQMVKEMGKGKK